MASGELTDGHESNEARRLLADYVVEHASTITNALSNHSRRMAEAADMADDQNQPHYSELFRIESAKTFKIMSGFDDLLERLVEGPEDYANQD